MYAQHIGVIILDFDQIPISDDARNRLLRDDSESWSGMTLREQGETVIVINPSHSRGRQTSTLMHEIAHLILKHVPARVDVSPTGMLLLSDYSEEAEAEADWLAAAMLLPREMLIRHRRRGASMKEISNEFGTSEQLCEWRLRMTGVDVQLKRAAAR